MDAFLFFHSLYWIGHQECCFSFDAFSRFTLSFLLLHLVQLSSPWAGCGFLSDILAPDDPSLLPRAPRPPCKQLPAQLSEMLLLACSLIKNLQRPLTAYIAKSQPVCLSFKSLHYPLPHAPSILFLTVSPNDPTFMTDLPADCDTLHVPPASMLCASCAHARNSLLCVPFMPSPTH